MNQTRFINISIIIAIVIFAGIAGYFIGVRQNFFQESGLVCTQEAKICPDGSAVGRNSGHNCEFDSCPEPAPENASEISLREGQRESSFLLEKIYSDRITGLNFGEYPIATNRGYPVTLRVGEAVSNGCTVTMTLVKIDGDTAVFTKTTDFNRPCPICLSGNTLIDTASGLIFIKDLRVGMAVWTVNRSGRRVSGIIMKTSKTPVPPTHQMVHLVFDDGRELFVSPGHPLINGRKVGNLAVNDFYDNARIVVVDRVAYGDKATYDILPSGDTGFYWANDILLNSTLH